MSSHRTICNVCRLACNVKMYCIKKIEFREIYKKVTKRDHMDQEPVILCYICRSQLLRCYTFSQMSCKTEKMLSDLYVNRIKVTETIAMMLDQGMVKNLTITMNDVCCITSKIDTKVEEEDVKVNLSGMVKNINPFKPAVCRVCLGNARAYCIRATGLQEIFENVTGVKPSNDDGRPCAICYICLSQLKRCFKFFEMSQRGKQENGGAMIEQTDDLLWNLKNIHNLSKGFPQLTCFDEKVNVPVILKEEPNDAPKSEVITRFDEQVTVSVPVIIKEELKDEPKSEEVIMRFDEQVTVNVPVIIKEELKDAPKSEEVIMRFDEQVTVNVPVIIKQEPKDALNSEYITCLKEQVTVNVPVIIKQEPKDALNSEYITCLKEQVTVNVPVIIKEEPNDEPKSEEAITRFDEQVTVNVPVIIKEEPKDASKSEVAKVKTQGNYSCNQCDMVFSSKSKLKAHKKIHRSRKYVCDMCNRLCWFKIQLIEHLRTHGFGKTYKCPHCPTECISSRSMYLHISNSHEHNQAKKYVCPECNKAFSTNSQVKTHILRHADIRPHVCDECGKAFVEKSVLSRHVLTHSKSKSHECDVCSKKFSDRNVMLRHKSSHYGVQCEKAFECSRCGSKFHTQDELLAHGRQHTVGRFCCRICFKDFPNNKSLNGHAEFCKYIKCEECERTFINKRSLTRHMKEHKLGAEGVKSPTVWTCKLCNKTVQNLYNHMKAHSELRPYGCSYCDKKFKSNAAANRHEANLHEKPRLPCTSCDLTFTQQKLLKAHLKAHQSNGEFVCFLCKREFYRKKYLKLHLKRIHKVVETADTSLPRCESPIMKIEIEEASDFEE